MYLENLKPQAIATASKVVIPYPIGDDACAKIYNTDCPISKGELVKYSNELALPKFLPLGVSILNCIWLPSCLFPFVI